MRTMDLESYGPLAAQLLLPEREMELGPGKPNQTARPLLDQLSPETLFQGSNVADQDMARACCAALWLYHDFLDESHNISQTIKSRSGSYWHAVMHRREGDFSNSKYWFRNTGDHAVLNQLSQDACELAQQFEGPDEAELLSEHEGWDPYRFVDLCERAIRGEKELEPLCKKIQMREWWLLFDGCYERAKG